MILFQVLGAVRLRVDGVEVELASMHQRLLGLLLARRGHAVRADAMIEALWPQDPPRTARKTVQIYVYRLRRLMGEDSRIVRADSGYQIILNPEELDAELFEQLAGQAAQARARGDLEAAEALLDKALRLWDGPAFDGLGHVAEVSAMAAWLEERRLTAFEDRVEIELELGRHADVAARLLPAIAENPYRERLRGQLMRALHRTGRRAEALEVYRQTRQLLITEVGVEPHAELQALHHDILRAEPADTLGAPPVPRLLPHDVPDFVGRQRDLDWLGRNESGTLVISAIAGIGGIGKTALGLHWAHRAAAQFPDGQLYVNLRGYAAGPPLSPLDALVYLLRCLGVPRDELPAEVEVASALFRSLLADRKMLVLLDNARTAEQVRPLLPGNPACRVIVTSRDRLSGLVAGDGARRLTLGLLPEDHGRALLRRLLGDTRVDAEPEAAARIVACCAGLPLALRIAAAKLADQPDISLCDYAKELAEGNRLAALTLGDDEERAVKAVLDRSYETLPPELRHAFSLLGFIPGPDFSAELMAALSGASRSEASSILDGLAAVHLIEPTAPHRYGFHDLVREYARAKSETEDPSALKRLLEHLRDMTIEARSRIDVENAPPGRPRLGSTEEAMAWLEAERANLIRAVSAAANAGWDELACEIAGQTVQFLGISGHAGDVEGVFTAVAAPVEGLPDGPAKFFVLNALGVGYRTLGRYDEAARVLRQAIDGRDALGDEEKAASSRHNLSSVCRLLGRWEEALQLEEAALATARKLGSKKLEMLLVSSGLPALYEGLGRHEEALESLMQALAMARESDSSFHLCRIHNNLGVLHIRSGDAAAAQVHFTEGLEIADRLGARQPEAHLMLGLGSVHSAFGRHDEAIALSTKACGLLEVVSPARVSEALVDLGDVFAAAGMPGDARERYERALALAEQRREPYARARALAGLGRLLGSREHIDAAIELFQATAPHEAEKLRAAR